MKFAHCATVPLTAGLLAPHVAALAHASRPQAIAAGELLPWTPDPLLLLLLAASGALYLAGVARLWRRSHRGLRAWRAACFGGGWLALAVALLSPLDPMGEVLFSMHMVQHELLMQVAAPLMVLSRPLAVVVWALPFSWRRAMGQAVKAAPIRAVWACASAPWMAWLIQALVLWLWHAPPFFQAGMRDPAVHAFQHVCFVFSALLFWWTLLQGRQAHGGSAASILYLLTTGIHTGMLAALLIFSSQAWYPAYDATAAWGMTPLEDQQLGGLIMWVPGGLVYLAAAIGLVARLLQPSAEGAAAGRARHGAVLPR